MFVHSRPASTFGRHGLLMTYENVTVAQYEKLGEGFTPKPGAAMAWAATSTHPAPCA